MSLVTGQILDGKYRIVRELGSGAMGAVYEGEQFRIKRRVAIKVMSARICQDENAARRFEREAQAAGRIGSEHIIEVLDLGTLADGGLYLVMELLEGCTLRESLGRSGRQRPERLVPLMQQLLTGLEAAHGARIIHRDLKPDNVFLCREHAGIPDFVKLLDFGISKFNPLADDAVMSMTRTGAVLGTPYYMSPEQARGARDVDHRSDLYSVGVMMYEAVTGQRPFQADTFNELVFKVGLETPPPLESFVPELDPEFAALVRRAMARSPNDRFQSAAELRDALGAWLHRSGVERQSHNGPSSARARAFEDDALATLLMAPREPFTKQSRAKTDPLPETQRSHPAPKRKTLPIALFGAAAFALGGLLAWQTTTAPRDVPEVSGDGPSPRTTNAAPPGAVAPQGDADARGPGVGTDAGRDAAVAPRAAEAPRAEPTPSAVPNSAAAPSGVPAAPSFAAASAEPSNPSSTPAANALPTPHPKSRPGAAVDVAGKTTASPSKTTHTQKGAQGGGRRMPTGL